MPTLLENCGNVFCKKTFLVQRCSAAFAPNREKGVIKCPYCSWNRQAGSDLVYIPKIMSYEEEACLTQLCR